jgi:hypothetical protein
VVQGAVLDGLIGPVRPSPRNAWIVLLGYAAFVGCARRFWRGRGVQVVCAVRVGGEAVPAPGPAAPAPHWPGPRQRPVRAFAGWPGARCGGLAGWSCSTPSRTGSGALDPPAKLCRTSKGNYESNY